MSWEDQGRQYHMWFGHGTAPKTLKEARSGAMSTNASRGDLAVALAYGAVAALPAAQRARAEALFQGNGLSGFRQAMETWMRGAAMDPATFADRFFGRDAHIPSFRGYVTPLSGRVRAQPRPTWRKRPAR